MDDPQVILSRIDAVWREVWAQVERLSEAELGAKGAGADRRPQDVLAHYARWLDWHREAIRERATEGTRRSYRGFNDWNAAWAAADASLTAGECRARLRDAFESFRRELIELAPDRWDDAIVAFAEQPTLNHMPEHLPEIAEGRDPS